MKDELQMPLRALCREVEVPPATLRRWRKRQGLGQPLLRKPGPKKLEPLPLETLQREIANLRHGARRTGGTGALQRRYEQCVSRRDFEAMVVSHRRELHRLEREALQRVVWLCPGVVWAMDDTEWKRDADGRKLLAHDAQDLYSRYHFEAGVSFFSTGAEVALWLRNRWKVRPAPLVAKFDRGSPFNNPQVDAVLAEFHVIPLISPPRYPRYNGAKENGCGEIKKRLGRDFGPAPRWNPAQHGRDIALAIHDLNHTPRPCLQGRVSCEVEFGGARLHFTRRDRSAIFDSICKDFRERISREPEDHVDRPCQTYAWRQAVEAWLRCQGLIRVTLNQTKKCQPILTPKSAHY